MAEDRVFTLIGRFDDQITKHLVAINKEFANVGKGLKSLTKDAEAFGKSIDTTANSVRSFSRAMRGVERDGGKAFKAATDSTMRLQDAVKGVQGSVLDMKEGFSAAANDSAAAIRSIADAYGDVIAAAERAAEAGRGVGETDHHPQRRRGGGDGYTIGKGVAANVIASGVESVFGMAVGAVRGVSGAVMGKVREAIDDEMDDIATAGGIFSMGKVYKMQWADTYNEAVEIQKEMDRRMAVLAAKLPGETDQYVRNAKQVADTVMKMTATMGPAFVQTMQGFDSSVKNSRDAFLRGTEELAKYATLTDEVNKKAAGGGMPFNMLVETLLGKDKIDVNALKRRYVAIGRNPLLSGALDRNIDSLNKAAADSPERFKAMLKLLKEMYPAEVVKAMTRSVDGAYQGMKSALFGMQEGMFGLKREFEITLQGTGKKMKVSIYQIGRDIFGAFAAIITPILEVLPLIFDPLKKIGQAFSRLYVFAKNAAVVIERETKKYADKGLSMAPFRASMKTLSELARWMEGDAEKIANLNKMLDAKDLDIGKALVAGFDTLFTSNAMDEIGYAIGSSIAIVLKDLVKLAKSGAVVDEKGLVAGFLRGWKAEEGGKAIGEMIAAGFKIGWKVVSGVFMAGMERAPVETALLTGLITGVIPNLLAKSVFGLITKMLAWIGARMAAASLIAAACNPITPAIYALATGIGTKVAAMMAGILPALQGIAAGATALTQVVVGGFLTFLKGLGAIIASTLVRVGAMLAPLINPVTIAAAIVVAVGLIVYAFKDQIRAGIEAVSKWISSNFQGPLKDALLGVTTVWKGIVNTIVGSIDWLIGLVTGDKAKMQAAGKAVSEGISQFFGGWKAIIANAAGALMQAGKMWVGWALKTLGDAAKAFFSAIANGVKQAMGALNGLRGNFISTVSGAVMGLARRIFSWLTGIQLPNTPTPPNPNDNNKTPKVPLPKPVEDAINFYKFVTQPKTDPNAAPQYNGKGKAMPLLDAIRTEVANKPAGSDLVIANSTETVIPAFDGWVPKMAVPAAGGNGLKSVFGTVANGFKAVNAQYQAVASGVNAYGTETRQAIAQSDRTSTERYEQTTRTIGAYHRQTQEQMATISGNLANLSSQVATLSAGGLGGSLFGLGAGSGANKVVAVGKALQKMGLHVAENPAFGTGRVGQHAPNSLHYSGRAIDVTGPAALLDQAYAQLKATNPTELLWRTAGHYDHLHVAYALGKGMPAFFNSMQAAQQWERSMVAGSVKVGSVTGNSKEGFGETVVNVGGITVHAGDVRDADELASIVAMKIGEAVNDAVAASIFI